MIYCYPLVLYYSFQGIIQNSSFFSAITIMFYSSLIFTLASTNSRPTTNIYNLIIPGLVNNIIRPFCAQFNTNRGTYGPSVTSISLPLSNHTISQRNSLPKLPTAQILQECYSKLIYTSVESYRGIGR